MKNTKNNVDQTTKKIGKQILQQELMQYVKDFDATRIIKVANTITKKVLQKYALYSNDGYKLWQASKHKNTNNSDVKDLRQVACLGLCENINTTNTSNNDFDLIIKNTFKKVNTYLYSLRSVKISNRPFDYSIQELTDKGIQLVNIHKNIVSLIKENDNVYTLTDNENEKAKKDRQLVIAILRQLTPLQKQVAKMLALGNSTRQIATKLNRCIGTIQDHIKYIRKKAQKVASDMQYKF